MWSQTPAFTLVLDPKDDAGIEMKAHHGIIKSLDFRNANLSDMARSDMRTALVGQKLQDIHEWTSFLRNRLRSWDDGLAMVAGRLDELLPIPRLPKH
jgi:lipoate-protein ligase A